MSYILSSREMKIIKIILQSNYGVTINEIADKIGVSKRTILRTMPTVYGWFDDNKISYDKSTNQGIVVSTNESLLKEALKSLEKEEIINFYNKKERMLFLITELLESKEPLNLAYFGSVLGVSEATISHDLNELEDSLKKYNLEVYKKQGYGIEIRGKERDKRKALVDQLYDSLDGEQIKTAVSKQIGMKQTKANDVRSKLLDLIDVSTVQLIEESITKSEKEMGFKFAESSFTALAVHLALAVQRLKNDDKILMKEEVLENIKLFDEFVIAQKLVKNLESQLNLEIPVDEVGYVTIHLKGARYKNNIYDSNVLKFNEIIISNYQLANMINKMISIAEHETGYQLKQVDSLLIGLVEHLRPAITRLELKLNIRNPLLEKIKTEYKEIFEISKKCSVIINQELGVELPESEIGYIAMHIGSAIEQLNNRSIQNDVQAKVIVTCTSGIGSSKMLAERIKKEFKNINIRQVFSATDIQNEWLIRHKIDFIISTVPFENSLIPVITVNPLLLKNDIKKLNNFIKTMSKNNPAIELEHILSLDKVNSLKEYSTGVIEVMQNINILENIKVNNHGEIIEEISNYFDPNNNGLKDEIMRREEVGSIVFDNEGLLFLHARTQAIDSIKVGIFRLEESIIVNNISISTVLSLFAPKIISPLKLEVIGEISATLVNDEDFISQIKYDHKEDVYLRIEQMMLQFFENKMK